MRFPECKNTSFVFTCLFVCSSKGHHHSRPYFYFVAPSLLRSQHSDLPRTSYPGLRTGGGRRDPPDGRRGRLWVPTHGRSGDGRGRRGRASTHGASQTGGTVEERRRRRRRRSGGTFSPGSLEITTSTFHTGFPSFPSLTPTFELNTDPQEPTH